MIAVDTVRNPCSLTKYLICRGLGMGCTGIAADAVSAFAMLVLASILSDTAAPCNTMAEQFVIASCGLHLPQNTSESSYKALYMQCVMCNTNSVRVGV